MASTNPGPASEVTTNTQSIRSTHSTLQTIGVTLSPSSVAANTTAEQTFSGLGTGILAGDVIVGVVKPTLQAGLDVSGWRVDGSTNDKFYVQFGNNTASPITPTASEVYLITVVRFIPSVTTTPGTLSTVPTSVTSN